MIAGKLLKEIKTHLAAAYGDRLRGVVLYGSEARGDCRPDSDIDIALVFESLADEEKLIYKFNCCCLPPDTIHVLNHILFRVMI